MFLWFFAIVGFLFTLGFCAATVYIASDKQRRGSFRTAYSLCQVFLRAAVPKKKKTADLAICTFAETPAWVNVTRAVQNGDCYGEIMAKAAAGRPAAVTMYIAYDDKTVVSVTPDTVSAPVALDKQQHEALVALYPVMGYPHLGGGESSESDSDE